MSDRARLFSVTAFLAAGGAGLTAVALWVKGVHPFVCNGDAFSPGPSGWVWLGFGALAFGLAVGGFLGTLWTEASLRAQRFCAGIALGEGIAALALGFWLFMRYSNRTCGF